MATVFVSQSELDEFEEECPTVPDGRVGAFLTLEDQLNGAASVRQMAARTVPHWTDRLARSLDRAPVTNDPGWAGRTAR
jgi:hypothetical protein